MLKITYSFLLLLATLSTLLLSSCDSTAATDDQPKIAAGSLDTVVDSRDGRKYPVVKIGSQTWMARNLDWQPPVPVMRTDAYGGMYSASAARGPGLCPDGWRVSSAADWIKLRDWATTQSGVTLDNLGKVLHVKDTVNCKDCVDAFGFHATSFTFWTSTSDSARFTRMAWLAEPFRLENAPDSGVQTIYALEVPPFTPGPDRYVTVANTASVRCLKNEP